MAGLHDCTHDCTRSLSSMSSDLSMVLSSNTVLQQPCTAQVSCIDMPRVKPYLARLVLEGTGMVVHR